MELEIIVSAPLPPRVTLAGTSLQGITSAQLQ